MLVAFMYIRNNAAHVNITEFWSLRNIEPVNSELNLADSLINFLSF